MTEEELKNLWLVDEHDRCLFTAPAEVTDFTEIPALASKMFEIMEQARGVGLSANQIGVDAAIFVMRWPTMEREYGGEYVVVNPKILEYSEATSVYEEGCLSYPGLYISLARPDSVKVQFQDKTGGMETVELSGWPARIFQHEYDHIEGKLFIDYLKPLRRKMLQGKLNDISKGKIRVDYKMIFPK